MPADTAQKFNPTAVEKQKFNIDEVHRFVRNFKKDSSGRHSKKYFQCKIQSLEAKWAKCEELHHEVMAIKADNSTLLEDYVSTYEEAERLVEEYTVMFHEHVVEYDDVCRQGEQTTSLQPLNHEQSPVSNEGAVPLERIKIPKFNGDLKNWNSFQDIFNVMVHRSGNLGPVQKMQYLKASLVGDAEQVIKHLNITEANYEEAWSLVVKRFNNPRAIANGLMGLLWSIKPCGQPSASSIKEILNKTNEVLCSIKTTGQNMADILLVYMLQQKLDVESGIQWQNSIGASTEVPTVEQFLEFLSRRLAVLEAIQNKEIKKTAKVNALTATSVPRVKSFAKCSICKGEHKPFACRKFTDASVNKRRELIKQARLCFNCLSSQHVAAACPSTSRCKKCNGKHYTALHLDNETKENTDTETAQQQIQHVSSFKTLSPSTRKVVLLATAIVWTKDSLGNYVPLRALVDQGSQKSFITESAAQALGIQRLQSNIKIYGISETPIKTKGFLTVSCKQKWLPQDIRFNLHVLPRLTTCLPQSKLRELNLGMENEALADPSYNIPAKIDILLGADAYGGIILNGLKKVSNGQLLLQKTCLGWIISGPTNVENKNDDEFSLVTLEELDTTLKRFWEQEELTPMNPMSEEEREAERHFSLTTKRDMTSGRYIVRLPFKLESSPATELRSSMTAAIKSFQKMENRLLKDECLKAEYNDFLQNYLELGHMEEVPSNLVYKEPSYYLPHHAVIKPSSTTTKVRVVFNASFKTNSGKSLNDLLMVGPTIQDNIFDILLRWRTHAVVITGDIEKMFRQITVNTADTDFQRIVWRPKVPGPIKHYRLKTVTYGTASAPFQAVRVLHQLADDEKFKYPNACEVIKKDFYVDDLMTGTADKASAIALLSEIKSCLAAGKMNIRKWASNRDEVLESVSLEDRAAIGPISINMESFVKTLGLLWHPKDDIFSFKVDMSHIKQDLTTKRNVASTIARLYDPLGWLQPAIIQGKKILQQLWVQGVDWDENIPDNMMADWLQFTNQCQALERLRIPRYLGTTASDQFEIHGFCDASNTAYAAVVYLRVVSMFRDVRVSLITAKSKVAPLKVQSIPRLELCGAVLLSNLIARIKRVMKFGNEIPTFYWTDSTTVLAYINGLPIRWKTYVANRVSEIQTLSKPSEWHHIESQYNPADCASRGIPPNELINHPLWWSGPQWLSEPSITYKSRAETERADLERRETSVHLATENLEDNILTRFSSYTRLIRVVAYCLRMRAKDSRRTFLTTEELRQATLTCIRISQQSSYRNEIRALRSKGFIDFASNIVPLNPLLDSEGILRVGGRVENADLPYDNKHQILISPDCHFAKLIVEWFHQQTLHGGQQLVISTIRTKYWIPQVQKLVKSCIHKCIKCFKCNAQTQKQLMGNLPKERVTPNGAFLNCGLDFAGPITLKWSAGRGAKSMKSYIALFVCLVTKAIHLEVVSDLTSKACIAAIKRFVARRGLCRNIYSDCGTNFIGASKELKEQFAKVRLETEAYLANEEIKWHFNPPRSPHFGGLWEAGIKSVKLHLVKTIGNTLLNMEEMYTVLTQIEAALNSRPLSPISDDINDEAALTPGHFLIGRNLTAIPTEVPIGDDNLLKKWKLTQKIVVNFWKQWSREYLSRLQNRPKWMRKQTNVKRGQLVLVKDENYPPTKWPLARIIDVHPGDDGLVRVATVKFRGNLTKRAVAKLCPLPVDTTSEDEHCNHNDSRTSEESQANDSSTEGTAADSHPTRRTMPISYAGLALFLCIACLIPFTQALQTSKGIDQDSIQANSSLTYLKGGLVIENLGQAYLSKGTLQLKLVMKLSDIRRDEDNINDVLNNITRLCKAGSAITEEIDCKDLIDHLVSYVNEIKDKIGTLYFMRTRQRRGALGNILTAVFGVNDEVYKNIETLTTNQQNLRNMLERGNKLMLRATHVRNKTNSHVDINLKHFNERLNTVISRINEYNSWYKATDHNKINLQFLGTYQRALSYLQSIFNKYSSILESVYNMKDILNIVPTRTVRSTIHATESILPPSMKVLHVSLKPLKVQHEAETLNIIGFLPIVDIHKLDLFKASAIPHLISNRTYVVQDVTTNILGVSFDQQVYLELNESQFDDSIMINETSFVINSNMLYHIKNKPNCLIKEIYNTFDGEFCSNRIFTSNSSNILWKQLYARNKWLFVTAKPIPAHLICNGNREEVVLNGTGMLNLKPECVFISAQYTLSADRQEFANIASLITKPMQIAPNINVSSAPEIQLNEILKPSESFVTLINQAEDIQQSTDELIWVPIRNHHSIAAASITMSTLLIMGLICRCLYRNRFKCKTTQQHTTPRWFDSGTAETAPKQQSKE